MYIHLQVMSFLTSSSLDALENKMTFVTILTFVAFVGIPLFKILFKKR